MEICPGIATVMELSQETDDYIRESIDHTIGLPVPKCALLRKLRAVEASHEVLRHQYLSLQSKLREKQEVIDRSRAEASMNAVALKKFVEENHRLAVECSNLSEACKKWESECLLYDHDREALMDFANEADERAKEAEAKNRDLEEEKNRLVEELHLYKLRSEGPPVDEHAAEMQEERDLLDSLLITVFGKHEAKATAQTFFESHSGIEVCQKLWDKWSSLGSVTQKIIALVADVKSLQKDKDHLAMNLLKAEEEVNALFAENNVLNEENKRLIRQCHREKQHMSSSGGGSSSSNKGKRKSSLKWSNSPTEKKLDLDDGADPSQRQPLSPLQCNSPESRARKK